MGHHLERGGGSAPSVFGNCPWEVLQDRSTGGVGMGCQKSGEVVAATTPTSTINAAEGSGLAPLIRVWEGGRRSIQLVNPTRRAGGHVGVAMI